MQEAQKGHLHPMTHTIRHMVGIFRDLGFIIAEGPEIETEHYNFDALNVPKDHPARDLWDTFWLKPDASGERRLLRTHTSPVQIRYMEAHQPPIKIIAPGKVFRYEATDATHEVQFYQLEGLWVGRDVALSDLKGVLAHFFSKLFGKEIKTRFRPSYFPFVEPGVEVDMSCFKCGGEGCALCKASGWIEIMGAGMVHPNVLNNVGINSREWQGFAFGIGVDRVVMLKYGIEDVRLLYQGDLRVINQFSTM